MPWRECRGEGKQQAGLVQTHTRAGLCECHLVESSQQHLSRHNYLPSIDVETEAQRAGVPSPKSHSK